MHHPHADVTQRVQRALDAYLHAIGPDTLGLYTDDEGHWWPLNSQGWERVQAQFRQNKRARVQLADASSEHLYRFDYLGRQIGAPSMAQSPGAVSAVSFWVSTEYLEKHGLGRVGELSRELAALLPFCSGHAGLAFNCDPGLVGIPQELLKLCFRYPGLDIPHMDRHSLRVGTRVPTIAWQTFLGQPVLGEVGGAAGLRSRLQVPGTTVQELEGERAVVTLGARPEAGDTEEGRWLPAYQELARVLEPWTYFTPASDNSSFSPDDQRRWERRFLD